MFKNYIKVALRNIRKKKFYSFLNILGLAIGISACVMIVMYVQDELSYDTFHDDVENKYVMALNGKIGGQEVKGIFTPPPLAGTMLLDIPEVETVTRTWDAGKRVVRNENLAFTENEIFFADSNFFQFFDYELLRGDPANALNEPNEMVITESMARKYFGDEDPIGEALIIGNDRDSFMITGIAADPPSNTHFYFDILLSFSSTGFGESTNWLSNSLNTYVELKDGTNYAEVDQKMRDIVFEYVGPEIEQFMGITMEQMEEQGGRYGYFSIPILDLHLNASDVQTNFNPPGDMMYIYIFSIIGVFLIVLASVNFMNLSTASASGRAKEVGLRKTMGAERSRMISQFLIESVLYVIFAVFLSFVLIYLFLPYFNTLSGKALSMSIFLEPWFLGALAALIVVVGLLAGSYPAFYLTAFNPVTVLKGNISSATRSGGFRKVLVVGQFFISIGLIICTIIVNNQLQYMQNKNLGIHKDHTLLLTNTTRLGSNQQAFQQELNQDSRVVAASYSSFTIPGTQNVTVFKRPETTQDYVMAVYSADEYQQEALGFEMKSGRYFSDNFASDSTAIVINESAVQELGLQNPVGSKIIFPSANNAELEVIGVMKNFNFQSLREDIMPLAITLGENGNEMAVRFENINPQESIDLVSKAWSTFTSGEPLDYSFLDQDFDELFRQEQRLGNVFTAFTVLAIIIACLGLLGLSAYMAERRTREIGVRKVLGASVPSILGLLSMEFLKLIGISFILAIPVAWYFMQNWLQDFAYRIDINPLVFINTAAVTLVVVLLTISWQSLKAAYMNPVDSIKTE